MKKKTDSEQDEEQAKAQVDSIVEYMQDIQVAEDADDEDGVDETRMYALDNVLSVQVRSGWSFPGHYGNEAPEEFELLLCTGGPAVRIWGLLDEHCQPCEWKVLYQDWFTGWKQYIVPSEQAKEVQAYCELFHYGE